MWKFVKCIVAIILGMALNRGLNDYLFGRNALSIFMFFLTNIFWFSYVCNFYFPRKSNNTE